MRTYYAIVEKDPESAFGVTFPDLPTVFSAADEEEKIIPNAIEALRLWAEDEELPRPSRLDEVLSIAEARERLAAGAFIVRVPVIEDDSRVVRVNLTMEAGTLKAIDAAAEKRGLTRSAFLASCARKEIEGTA
ncbi:type II toxin-antitoxin system HicB family antitoxin [Sinorhizobium sp. 8-89]|uniref:type II toxin-antitoxin system HicB family antitoxin n=1 Tax=Sinorhizobium sp. 7-81 TaxID=3049087 RepID=UPI0024C316CD|nr:type II toxin-antitoxin system HicB family antitoxin [Sinorhizobium sp. 7-81]MDK1386351.1 type II toxin-antitoxin system HicB family antitoxin [Sinorhizobium sp. 7-81]